MATTNGSSSALTRENVEAAYKLVKPYIHSTPVLTNTTLSNFASTPQTAEALKGTQWEGQEPAKPKFKLFFKCENFQKIGAFKVRGAFHAITRLIEERGLNEVRKKGVVTHSSGKISINFMFSMREDSDISDTSTQATMRRLSPSQQKHSTSLPTS